MILLYVVQEIPNNAPHVTQSSLQSPLTAVALQDHMARELGLVSRAKPPKPIKPVHSGSVNMEYTLDPEVPPLTLGK